MINRDFVRTLTVVLLACCSLVRADERRWRVRPVLAEPAAALAVVDLDEDGVRDLLVAVPTAGGTRLEVHPGLTDDQGFPVPRVAEPVLWELELEGAISSLLTGDFDGDGHADVLAAALPARELRLLLGRGDGRLAPPLLFAFPGEVTAVASGEIGRRDGISDLVLALSDDSGSRALLYRGPRSFVHSHAPAEIGLAGPATAVEIAVWDGSTHVLVAAGSELVVIGAPAEAEDPVVVDRASLPASTSAMAVVRAPEGRRVVVLLADGRLLSLPSVSDNGPRSWAQATAAASEVARVSPGPAVLRALTLLPESREQLALVRPGSMELLAWNEGLALRSVDLHLEAQAVVRWRAVLEATCSLLVADGEAVVDVSLGLFEEFVVDDLDDDPDLALDGSCATAAGTCSLRAAIEEANAASSWALISFSGVADSDRITYPLSSLPTITGPMMIDGSSHPSGMVEIDGTASGAAFGLYVTGGWVTLRGLSVTEFSHSGISLGGSTGGSVIEGCHVGLDHSGMDFKGNSIGVSSMQSTWVNFANTIGGSSPGAGNVLSGNTSVGVWLAQGGEPALVMGNIVGLAADGITYRGNGNGGINAIVSATIGGEAAGEGNVISGNGGDGVTMESVSLGGPPVVVGNIIGLDASGAVARGNAGAGVLSSRLTTVGGLSATSGNTISANSTGVVLSSGASVVQGNRIGTSTDGLLARGNSGAGVSVSDDDSVVGGSEIGAGNTIAANGGGGVSFSGTIGQVVQGNRIGLADDGAAMGNGGPGVWLHWANQSTVGGLDAGEANIIAHNTGNGVTLSGGGLFNAVSGNSIHHNGGLGIDLGNDGPSANDVDDLDDGLNLMMNAPEVLWTLPEDASTVRVRYRFDGLPGPVDFPVTVELYLADNSSSLEGETLLAVDEWTEADLAVGVREVVLSVVDFSPRGRIVALATDDDGNSSEFGLSVEPMLWPELFADGFESADLVRWSAVD